jgi:hypothetical protein
MLGIMKTVLTLLIIALSIGAYELFVKQPAILSNVQNELKTAVDDNTELSAAASSLRSDLKEALAKLRATEKSLTQALKPDKEIIEQDQPAARAIAPAATPTAIKPDNRKQEGIRVLVANIQRESDAKIRTLNINAKKWKAELDRVQLMRGDFKEQSVDIEGRKSGIRTSDSDRASFAAKKGQRINEINAQLVLIRDEISRINSDTAEVIAKMESGSNR